MQRRWAMGLVLVTALAAAVVAFVPTSSRSCITLGDGPMRCTTAHPTLLSSEGPTLFIPLGIAVATAALALAIRSRRGALLVAVLLTVFMVLAAMSIGVFFLPAVVLAWIGYSTSARSPAK